MDGRKLLMGMAVAIAGGMGSTSAEEPDTRVVGFTHTPVLPGLEWRVHDGNRPKPPVVTPPAHAPMAPPPDAKVLFDGKDLSAWTGTEPVRNEEGKEVGRRDCEARWTVVDGAMEVAKTGDIRTREGFGSCELYIEWMSPAQVGGMGQGRGNSGIFLSPYMGSSTWRNLATYAPHGARESLRLQDHGDPVRFRNIWIRPWTPPKDAP